MIYWFTGQSGHGKTVLCNLLKDYIEKTYHKNVIHIDGDDIREIFQNKDYSKEGRIKNITFAQNLAHFCNTKGFFISPYMDGVMQDYDYETKMLVVSVERIREELYKCFKHNTIETFKTLHEFPALRNYIFKENLL